MSSEPEKIIYSMMRVSKTYQTRQVIKDISLSYFYGAKIGFLGLNGAPRGPELYYFGALLCAYVAGYLGVGRLIVLGLRRYLHFTLLLPLLIHVLLALGGLGIPFFLQAWIGGFRGSMDYTVLQAPNWGWTLAEAWDGNLWRDPAAPVLVKWSAIVANSSSRSSLM